MTKLAVLLLIVVPALFAVSFLFVGIAIGRRKPRRPVAPAPSLDDHFNTLPKPRPSKGDRHA